MFSDIYNFLKREFKYSFKLVLWIMGISLLFTVMLETGDLLFLTHSTENSKDPEYSSFDCNDRSFERSRVIRTMRSVALSNI